jgi:hypothetical protein
VSSEDDRGVGVGESVRAECVRQVGHVLADLPRFLTAPLHRHHHLRWRADQDEVDAALPGDVLYPRAQFRATRALTIAAPPQQVWPWLVQVGAGRAGWYSDDLLDDLGRPSATEVVPEWQHLQVGQWVPMSPWGPPPDRTAFRVAAFEELRWLLWTKPDSSWVWSLTALPGGKTRLVTRVSVVYDWSRPLGAALAVLLMEFGDFPMQRRMLLGIKVRAEALAAAQLTSARPDVLRSRPAPSGGPGPRLGLRVLGAVVLAASVLHFAIDVVEAVQRLSG